MPRPWATNGAGVGRVAAVGGSWMASAGLISRHEWDEVTRLAAEAVATVARHRPASREIPTTP